ncbi:MAG: AtpZ/AtpI family protein [Alphaproteobacteria bacterium]|nr:AtpZ/AtpI family protein [Alphaproteobacteria bacterium]
MAAGLAAGAVLGWVLDSWLGTKPWLLVAGFFLGGAAGILNVYRTARRMNADAEGGRDGPPAGDGR